MENMFQVPTFIPPTLCHEVIDNQQWYIKFELKVFCCVLQFWSKNFSAPISDAAVPGWLSQEVRQWTQLIRRSTWVYVHGRKSSFCVNPTLALSLSMWSLYLMIDAEYYKIITKKSFNKWCEGKEGSSIQTNGEETC